MHSNQEKLHCTYCGLPFSRMGLSDERSPVYCCSGCRFAHHVTQESGEEGSARWTLTKLAVSIFFSMNVLIITLAMWAYDLSAVESTQTAVSFRELFRYLCLLLAYPVLFLLAGPIVLNAWDELKRRRFSTDLLIVLGVVAAYTISTVAVWRSTGSIYFEVGCMILIFVTLGRWLEATGKLRSTESLDKLEKLLPEFVTLIDEHGEERSTPLADVSLGDVIVIREGERIPVDGVVIAGQTSVDEQFLTGESWPVERASGESVVGGTLALDGRIEIRVETPPEQSTLKRLVQAVRNARESRSRSQILADRISQVFVPLTCSVALIAFVIHYFVIGFVAAVMASLSVILIACPCALGLATPMALWAAVGTAARRGIAFRSLDALERLAEVTEMCFDKTGTLTTGHPQVRCLITDGDAELDLVRSRARHLCRASNHLFSRALADYLGPPLHAIEMQTSTVPGKGVYGMVNGEFQPSAIGNLRMMKELDIDVPEVIQLEIDRVTHAGIPFVLIGWGGSVRGIFELEETLRPTIVRSLEQLQHDGLSLRILTGDHVHSARRISQQLQIPIEAETSPEGKQQFLREQRELGSIVAFVGDGVNDAPALATADVGIALGCGAEVSRDSSDICLISNDISQISWLIHHAARTRSTIRTNLAWAFGYNSLGIVIAAAGWLHPAVAAILMVSSSLFVISNSLRLTCHEENSELPEALNLQKENSDSKRRVSSIPTQSERL